MTMTSVLRWFLILAVSAFLALLVFSYVASLPLYDESFSAFEPVIADQQNALTFARSADALILVKDHETESISGVDLTAVFGESATADLLSFYNSVGPDALRDLAVPVVTVPIAALGQPLAYTEPYIATGTNFSDHAEEVYHDDPPFLFPKLTPASDWQATVPFVPRLDFEAELCAFPLSDVIDPSMLPLFGFVLCNDFTDRWRLIREIDLGEPMGLTGFAAGKGCSGCMPTGYLVVIPADREFYKSVEVSLYVNDRLRQRYAMRDIIWPLEEIIRQSFLAHDLSYQKGDQFVDLMPSGDIPAGTLVLAGTAGGVIFKPANILFQAYYLQTGDIVRTEATYLGYLLNQVQQ